MDPNQTAPTGDPDPPPPENYKLLKISLVISSRTSTPHPTLIAPKLRPLPPWKFHFPWDGQLGHPVKSQ